MDPLTCEDVRNAREKIIYTIIKKYNAFNDSKNSNIYFLKKQSLPDSSDNTKKETLDDVIFKIASENYFEDYIIGLMLITNGRFFSVIRETINVLIKIGRLKKSSMLEVITIDNDSSKKE